MRYFIYNVIFCFFISNNGYSQQVYLEAGVSSASFKNYKNDLSENTLDNKLSQPQASNLGAGILFNIYSEKIKWDIGFNYTKHEINTSFVNGTISTPLFYDLSFVSLKTGVYIPLFKISRLKWQINSHYSFDWLTYGSYTYNNEFVDLIKGNAFYKTLFNYHIGSGLEYVISKNTSFYINYNVKKSYKKKKHTDESYQIYAKSIFIGILLRLEKLNKKNNQ